ncbi:MAG: hypothetical protein QE263_00510 [Vampirovibrionales bacterium]|nr:hypothetical protein [Vampirovibrionales bacterium]
MPKATKPIKESSRGNYAFTQGDCEDVAIMAAGGIPQDRIAKRLGVSEKTLRKHFRDELDIASDDKHKNVLNTAYGMAISGEHASMTMFWLKCRLGWKEKQSVEHTGPSNGPIQVNAQQKHDLSKLSITELKDLQRLTAKIKTI